MATVTPEQPSRWRRLQAAADRPVTWLIRLAFVANVVIWGGLFLRWVWHLSPIVIRFEDAAPWPWEK